MKKNWKNYVALSAISVLILCSCSSEPVRVIELQAFPKLPESDLHPPHLSLATPATGTPTEMATLYIENANRFFDTVCSYLSLVDGVRDRQGQSLSEFYQDYYSATCLPRHE